MIDLEKIEALAKAALWTGNWYDAGCNTVMCTYPADSEFAGESDEIAHPCPTGITGYMAAAQPSAVLALIAEVRALREAAVPAGFRIERYSFPEAGFDIIRTPQRTGPAKWKVFNGGYCLTKTGDWEWEPMPSSRTDEFIERCRFGTAQEAIDAARGAK